MTKEATIRINDISTAMTLFGKLDENLKLMQDSLNVNIFVDNSNSNIQICGEEENVAKTKKLINKLLDIISHGENITPQNVIYTLNLINSGEDDKLINVLSDVVMVTYKGKPIRCKTLGQRAYVNAMSNTDVVFGIGPAGTGKTYLAMAMAVSAFKNKEVNRIILTRPAVEAGEKLGFLPGNFQDKVDPYLRPLYDALFDILGLESFTKYMEKGSIEVAPLAFMRGRTLDDSYIILDEAQNTTSEQMKMFLTRIGFGSKAVITGDITQIDLPRDKESGLLEAMEILEGIKGISFSYLTDKDVVRHSIVQKIIQAYDDYDKNNLNEHRIIQKAKFK